MQQAELNTPLRRVQEFLACFFAESYFFRTNPLNSLWTLLSYLFLFRFNNFLRRRSELFGFRWLGPGRGLLWARVCFPQAIQVCRSVSAQTLDVVDAEGAVLRGRLCSSILVSSSPWGGLKTSGFLDPYATKILLGMREKRGDT